MSSGRIKSFFIACFQLGKPHISLAVSLSALTGFLLFSGAFTGGWPALTGGILLLSFSSAAINQIQERKLDAIMPRTSHRPLPSGRVSVLQAMTISIITGLSGSYLLWAAGGLAALGLGLMNLILYNGIYTLLKSKTMFAVVPGSLVGAIPPLIGWISAGGMITHKHILLVAMFFFIGQIPHTWLILLRYDKEYQKVGYPSLKKIFTGRQIASLTFTWTAATTMAAIVLSFSGVFQLTTTAILNMLTALVLLLSSARYLRKTEAESIRDAFMILNITYLIVMILLIADSLLR